MQNFFATARFHLANSVAVIFLTLVIFSGFAYPLQYGSGFWPFNRDWFMFSYDTGYDYELRALGKKANGETEVLDVRPFFQVKIAARGDRFQEMPRTPEAMNLLARFLCTKFPLASVSIQEATWLRQPGPRPPESEVAPEMETVSDWVKDVPCGS